MYLTNILGIQSSLVLDMNMSVILIIDVYYSDFFCFVQQVLVFSRHLSDGSQSVSDRFLEVPNAGNSLEVDSEERLRRRLAFFFMDPVRKFIARRQTPWKLLIQFLKIILVKRLNSFTAKTLFKLAIYLVLIYLNR